MEIEDFLIGYVIDIYEQYCYITLKISSEEFDSSFYDDEGNQISDLNYLINNYDDIVNEANLKSLYDILSFESNNIENFKKLIGFLARNYLIYLYDGNDKAKVAFLKKANFQQIIDLFLKNEEYGIEMLHSYFEGIINSQKMSKNQQMIVNNGDEKYLNRLYKQNIITEITNLNDLLREIIYDLYNLYIREGYSDIEALDTTWEYFLHDFDPKAVLDKLGCDIETKKLYKNYLLGLIMSDLYEDIMNNSIIDSYNEQDKLINSFVVSNAVTGNIEIPNDRDMRNRLLKYFILLQDEVEKKALNREQTYQQNRVETLEKVNPFYILDEISLKKKK